MTIKPKTFSRLTNAVNQFNEHIWRENFTDYVLEVTHKERGLKSEQQYYMATINYSNQKNTNNEMYPFKIFYEFDYYKIIEWAENIIRERKGI